MGNNIYELMERTKEERCELVSAVAYMEVLGGGGGSIDDAMAEAVDLGNTAMMVHSWLYEQKRRMGGLTSEQSAQRPPHPDSAGSDTPEQAEDKLDSQALSTA